MSSETFALALVLTAAFLHALANAITKASADALLTRAFMSAFSALVTLPALWLFTPLTDAAWKILAASVVLHAIYPFVLAASYRADLSVVFPIARGISPIAVFLLVLALDPGLPSWQQAAGVAVVTGAIFWLSAERMPASSRGAIAYAVGTGLVIGLYTYLDAHGVRAASTALSYIAWLVVIDGTVTTSCIALYRRGAVLDYAKRYWKTGTIAAALGLVNFAMALYAFSLGSAVEMAALRETTVVFAAFLGATALGEGSALRRMAAAAAVALGIVLMRL